LGSVKEYNSSNTNDIEEFMDMIERYRTTEVNGVYVYKCFLQLVKKNVETWKDTTFQLHEEFGKIHKNVLNLMIVDLNIGSICVEDLLKDKLYGIIEKSCKKFSKNLNHVFDLLAVPETYNHYFSNEKERLRLEAIKIQIKDKLEKITPKGSIDGKLLIDVLESFKGSNTEFAAKDLIIDYNSYIKVEVKTFIDLLAKEITFCFITSVVKKLDSLYKIDDQDIDSRIYEMSNRTRLRTKLLDKIPRFEQAMNALTRI